LKKDDDSQGKKGKVVTISSKKENRGKPGKSSQGASKKVPGSNNAFVTDARFHRAMDLVREDMNNALSTASNANNSFYFLLKFLIEKKVIDRDEFEAFVAEEIENMPKQGEDEEYE